MQWFQRLYAASNNGVLPYFLSKILLYLCKLYASMTIATLIKTTIFIFFFFFLFLIMDYEPLSETIKLIDSLFDMNENDIQGIIDLIYAKFFRFDIQFFLNVFSLLLETRPIQLNLYKKLIHEFINDERGEFKQNQNLLLQNSFKSKYEDIDPTLFNILVNDDLENLKLYFDPSDEEFGENIIEQCSVFGADKCFMYAILNFPLDVEKFANYAIQGGNNQIIMFYFNNGVDLSKYLEIAIKYHRENIIDFILSNYSIEINISHCIKYHYLSFLNSKIEDLGLNALKDQIVFESAIEALNIDLVQYIVSLGFDVNSCDVPSEETPIFAAVRSNSIKILNFLIENKAEIDHCDSEGWTPLMLASYRDKLDAFKILVNHNADTQHKDNSGFSVFSYASPVIKSYIQMYARLLD